MKFLHAALLALVTSLGSAGLTPYARGQELPPDGIQLPEGLPSLDGETISQLVRGVQALIALDKLTETGGDTKVDCPDKLHLKGANLVLTFCYRQIEVNDHITNRAMGVEIPGRRIDVKVLVDCDVHCWLDMTQVKIEKDATFNDTFLVLLPDSLIKTEARFPDDSWATYEVNYGFLRSRYASWDQNKAKQLRQDMYDYARLRAKEEFDRNYHLQSRRLVADALQQALRSQYPSLRIYVK